MLSFSCEVLSARIYYTTDGTIPTNKSIKYKSPFSINVSTTIRAIAIVFSKDKQLESKLVTAAYIIQS